MGLVGPVAAEFFVNATSPKRPFRLAAADAAALVEAWFAFPTLELTPALFRATVDLQQQFQLSYWDAAILGAARQMGCRTVFSEDLNDGQLAVKLRPTRCSGRFDGEGCVSGRETNQRNFKKELWLRM